MLLSERVAGKPEHDLMLLFVMQRGDFMSSQIIVVLVMVVLAILGLGYLEMNSRRNQTNEEEEKASDE